MRQRIIIGLSVAMVLALIVFQFSRRPGWLLSMHGKNEASAIAISGNPWRAQEFKPDSSLLKGVRKRLLTSLPANCDRVRELRFHDSTYVYYAWLVLREDEWVVFDTGFHHEDRPFPPHIE